MKAAELQLPATLPSPSSSRSALSEKGRSKDSSGDGSGGHAASSRSIDYSKWDRMAAQISDSEDEEDDGEYEDYDDYVEDVAAPNSSRDETCGVQHARTRTRSLFYEEFSRKGEGYYKASAQRVS